MEALALLGVSHRRGGTRTLNAYAEAYALRSVAERLRPFGLQAFVEIQTCNRIDVVLTRNKAQRLEELREALSVPEGARQPYVYSGEGAFEQLARVAASMDSMNPGEDQIMRQVRDAVREARAGGRVDATLSFAIDAAFRIARRVRRDVALAPRETSLFSLVRPEIQALLKARGGSMRALVIGAGEMARLSAASLRGLGGIEVLITNRTFERAQSLAAAIGGRAVAWCDVAGEASELDLLVSAIPGAPDWASETWAALEDVRLVVDLGVPRSFVGRWVERLSGRLIDMEALESMGVERRQEIEGQLREAERVLSQALHEELGAWAERALAPSIQHLHALYQSALGEVLPDAQARSMAHRLAHLPIRGLRALARDHGIEAVWTFAVESGIEAPVGSQP